MGSGGGRVNLPALVGLVERFGEAIEADLHRVYGIDILDFFRGRYSWRKFRALVERLPAASHFGQALADDEELARELGGETGRGGHHPPMATFSPELAELMVVNDRLAALVAMLAGDRSAYKPRPRPMTAHDRLAARERARRMDSLIAEVEAAQVRWKERRG